MSSLSRTLARRAAREDGRMAPHKHFHRKGGLAQARARRRTQNKIARASRKYR